MWNFRNLEQELITDQVIEMGEIFSTEEFDLIEG